MANATILEFQIQDDQGLKNRSAIYVAYNGATLTVDALIGAWLQVGGLIDDCIDGQIMGGQITVPLEPDATWKATPTVGNNVNQVMTLNFENDFNQYLTALLLPSYKEAILTPTRLPDLADPELDALIDYMIAGSATVFPNSRDLHDIDALRDAFLTVRKVRGQTSRTRVVG